jgi:hypothetical protein
MLSPAPHARQHFIVVHIKNPKGLCAPRGRSPANTGLRVRLLTALNTLGLTRAVCVKPLFIPSRQSGRHQHPQPSFEKEDVMKLHIALASAAALALTAAPSFAQTAPTPEWTGEGSVGAGVTTGNTSTTDVGIAAKLKHTGMKWSESGEFTDDYGKTDHVETKNRVAAAGQVDRSITDRLSGFGRVTYENDKFSGFENRYYAGVGLAYKVIVSDKTNWTLQGGPGYKVDEVRDQGVGPDRASRSRSTTRLISATIPTSPIRRCRRRSRTASASPSR